MDKYGVDTEEHKPRKESGSKKTHCPSCGTELEADVNVLKCPKCGTEPFEAR